MSSSKTGGFALVKKLSTVIYTGIILAGLLAAGIVVTGIIMVSDLTTYAHRTIGGGPSGASVSWEKTVVLSPGAGFAVIMKELTDAGVVSDPRRFRLLARVLGYDRRIMAGEYLFSSDMPPLDILNRLAQGKVVLHVLTVPEGYNLREIAALIGEKGFGDPRAFLARATSAAYAAEQGIAGKTLEGYLFPDTYYFPRHADIDRIIQTMIGRFDTVFTPAWAARARDINLTRHQVVTLASIIEKETGAAGERPVISSVFHNRLKQGMKLQSDPTVIYAIEDFDGNLTREHLSTPTPYNTYAVAGLPPGPIASPGKDALAAALFPEKTDYLYFVARGNGTHQFSTRLSDHNDAVRRYQLHRGESAETGGAANDTRRSGQ